MSTERDPSLDPSPTASFDFAPPPTIVPAAWLYDPPKFQHRYWVHILYFVLTLGSTTWAGADYNAGFASLVGSVPTDIVSFFRGGLWFSLSVLAILGAHEFGHYFLCRRHNVDATLPYFIPGPPFVMAGTFGAVIKIKEAFPSKAALFDIGIAGPIGGFVVLVPLLFWGVSMSTSFPVPAHGDMIYFGEPLLIKAAIRLKFGVLPPGYDISLHPMAFAAWWGMLATSLNLLPFGQLDGGHIVYSLLGKRAALVSSVTLITVALLTAISYSWIAMAAMMLVMAFVLGLHHPRVIDEHTPLDTARRLVAIFALIMFALCFTPVPVEMLIGN